MVLKELIIRNFRSYYGDSNRFDFNPEGLTLIIGDNGDGKTTFFEALEWLFDTTGLREKEEIKVNAYLDGVKQLYCYDEVTCIGRASNGEAFYKKVS